MIDATRTIPRRIRYLGHGATMTDRLHAADNGLRPGCLYTIIERRMLSGGCVVVRLFNPDGEYNVALFEEAT